MRARPARTAALIPARSRRAAASGRSRTTIALPDGARSRPKDRDPARSLRRLGLPLDEIAAVLDQDPDLVEAVRRHLAQVERSLALQRQLHRALGRLLEVLESEQEPTLDEFIQAIEVMTMTDKYYTPEQQEQLEQRRGKLGEEGMRQAERDWAELTSRGMVDPELMQYFGEALAALRPPPAA